MTIEFVRNAYHYRAEVIADGPILDEILSVTVEAPSGAVYELPDPLEVEEDIEAELEAL